MMEEPQKNAFVDHLKALLNDLFIGDHNDWLGRLFLVLIISGFLYVLLHRQGVKGVASIFFHTFFNDFFYPVCVVFVLLYFESLISYHLTGGDAYRFFVFIPGFVILVFIPYKLTNTISIQLAKLLLFCFFIFLFMCCYREEFFSIHHFVYELLAVLLTFIIYFTFRINLEYKKENSRERAFWDSYIGALNNADTRVIAINTENYSDFMDSVGYRYFAEQLKVFSNPQKYELTKQRFFIISQKKSELKDSDEIQCLNTENLSDKTRNFKSLYILHKIAGIKMFLVPKDEVEEIIQNSSTDFQKLLIMFHFKKSWKVLDRLIIDKTLNKPDEKNNSSTFLENYDENKNVIDIIIANFANNDYDVDILANGH